LAYAKVRIHNDSDGFVNIVDSHEGRVAVGNLCPGGSITLYRARDLVWDPNNVAYHYTAEPIDTKTYVSVSSGVIVLSEYQYDFLEDRPDWHIKLQKK
jgi:hypothetical protein